MPNMKILILTQKIDKNDDVLGFFHRWVLEFAKYCEKVTVICLQKGEYDLPKNVKVLSLGKEKNFKVNSIINSRVNYRVKYVFNFYKYIFKERKNYDAVFVHMNPEYVVLGGIFWRLMGKKVGIWYAHGYVSLFLKTSLIFSDFIFTSSKKGCRLNSDKVKVVRQGIDVDYFKPLQKEINNKIFTITTIGRISPIKDYETLIEAAYILKKEGFDFKIIIIGGADTFDQKKYFDKLNNLVIEKNLGDVIYFNGPVANKDILNYLHNTNLFVNMSRTGSLDKAVLEAMACGIPIITSNEAFYEEIDKFKQYLLFKEGDSFVLAKKIKSIYCLKKEELSKISHYVCKLVKQRHSLGNFISSIMEFYV